MAETTETPATNDAGTTTDTTGGEKPKAPEQIAREEEVAAQNARVEAKAKVDEEAAATLLKAHSDAAPKAEKPSVDSEVRDAFKAGEYKVRPTETLLDVANKFGVSTDSLARENRLQTGARTLVPGQVLKLPTTTVA